MKPLILLDRDGVLNRLVIDPEHGTIDSPLHVSQVELLAGVSEAVAELTRMGYLLAIVTNQPAAAKGKTTQKNLHDTHELILQKIQERGGIIQSSHFCFHRSEDGCTCRKPRTGLLEEAIQLHATQATWMVGDGVTDIQAGAALGISTVFLGPKKCDACRVFNDFQLKPSFWAENLLEFAQFLKQTRRQ